VITVNFSDRFGNLCVKGLQLYAVHFLLVDHNPNVIVHARREGLIKHIEAKDVCVANKFLSKHSPKFCIFVLQSIFVVPKLAEGRGHLRRLMDLQKVLFCAFFLYRETTRWVNSDIPVIKRLTVPKE
jgi:hypothetical protein